VLDGLLEATGGALENIANIIPYITFIKSRVEDCRELGLLIEKSDLIIDSMAWTTHTTAFSFPEYDLDLNCRSHLNFLNVLKEYPGSNVVYIGSKVQYGNLETDCITEDTPMLPEDIQGVHKLAAETYYKIYSKLYNLNAISLRIPGCIGNNQPWKGKDLGLVGNFIRDAIKGEDLVVFGSGRKRSLLFMKNLEEVVSRIAHIKFKGFDAYNVAGTHVKILDIAKSIIEITGNRRDVIVKEIDQQFVDIGNVAADDSKLREFIGDFECSEIISALTETIEYYKRKINDLQM
jgi:UDP-glucose 4-epimerase